MTRCAVKGCQNIKSQRKSGNLSFFSFPKDEIVCKAWVKACKNEEVNTKNGRVCSIIFLLGPVKMKNPEESEPVNVNKSAEEAPVEGESRVTITAKVCKIEGPALKEVQNATIPTCTAQSPLQEHKFSVPEVYVRPPTPTPSIANLPIITVSSPSRRSSMASMVSRRGSDMSTKSLRRNSECSVRFVNEDDTTECKRTTEGSFRSLPRMREEFKRSRSPESPRRYSENITPTGSTRELRRCSDFTHEKNRGSQFATKLRRNSDFGNRTPKRMLPPDEYPRLPKVLDLSPTESRRNSDIGTFIQSPRPDSRRNSESFYRRNSEFVHIKPLMINRRSSDISIRTLETGVSHTFRVFTFSNRICNRINRNHINRLGKKFPRLIGFVNVSIERSDKLMNMGAKISLVSQNFKKK